MKKWLLSLGSLTAIGIAVVVALVAAGVFDDDDASGEGGNALGVCVEGVEDCVDTVVDTDGGDEGADQGLDQTCEAGTADCVDTPGSDGFGQTCLAGSADCGDDPGSDGFDEKPDDDEGTSIAPVCAPDHPDCADTLVVPDGGEGGDGEE